MVSKREEVFFLLWGNLLQTAKGHYRAFATPSFGGEKSGGNWTGVNNLQQVGAEVGRCARDRGRERKTAGVVSGTKKNILLMQA